MHNVLMKTMQNLDISCEELSLLFPVPFAISGEFIYDRFDSHANVDFSTAIWPQIYYIQRLEKLA